MKVNASVRFLTVVLFGTLLVAGCERTDPLTGEVTREIIRRDVVLRLADGGTVTMRCPFGGPGGAGAHGQECWVKAIEPGSQAGDDPSSAPSGQ